jgi:uncharacterized protein (TIGR00251 family)
MRINVKVVPKSGIVSVEKTPAGLRVKLTSVPEKGAANKELIDILAEHFTVPKSRVRILKGQASRNKLVEILD